MQIQLEKRLIRFTVVMTAVLISCFGCAQKPPRVYKIASPAKRLIHQATRPEYSQSPNKQKKPYLREERFRFSSQKLPVFQNTLPTPTVYKASNTYHIGVGDVLQVKIFQLLDLDREAVLLVTVDRKGQIYLPQLSHVEVEGLTGKQVQEELVTRLAKRFIRNPKVDVRIHKYNSKVVMVLGLVSRPGPQTLDSDNTTLLDVIAKAGGIRMGATLDIEILRQGYNPAGIQGNSTGSKPAEYVREVVPISKLFLEEGHGQVNPIINPGDVVKIRPSNDGHVYLAGEVERPGVSTFRRPMTILPAVPCAGGATKVAATKKCQIIRRDSEGAEKEIIVDLDKIRKGEQTNILLARNDTIHIPVDPVKKFFEDINKMFQRGFQAGTSFTYDAAQDLGIPSGAAGSVSGL